MARTRVSSKYRIVIPKEIRDQLEIHPGQEIELIVKGGLITLVPVKPIAAMRGFVRGIRMTGFREKMDRF
jgi:AbrB family looped-hinge helix DNA binding protein